MFQVFFPEQKELILFVFHTLQLHVQIQEGNACNLLNDHSQCWCLPSSAPSVAIVLTRHREILARLVSRISPEIQETHHSLYLLLIFKKDKNGHINKINTCSTITIKEKLHVACVLVTKYSTK